MSYFIVLRNRYRRCFRAVPDRGVRLLPGPQHPQGGHVRLDVRLAINVAPTITDMP